MFHLCCFQITETRANINTRNNETAYLKTMMTNNILLYCAIFATTSGFVVFPSKNLYRHNVLLNAAGKGFGKKSSTSSKNKASSITTNTSDSMEQNLAVELEGSMEAELAESNDLLSSVEGSSISKPSLDTLDFDPSMTPDERQEMILRKQFGLSRPGESTAQSQNWSVKDKRYAEEEKDIFDMLPPSLLKAFDSFLKIGLGICTTTFMAAGVLITLEAWQNASGDTSLISPELDDFIVNTVEPNFTPGLLVLLAFSVTLGVFSIASGGSQSSQYRE